MIGHDGNQALTATANSPTVMPHGGIHGLQRRLLHTSGATVSASSEGGGAPP